MIKLQTGKFNILLGGSFGSEGKGSVAQAIGGWNPLDVVCMDVSPNAGHTIHIGPKPDVVRMLPASVIGKRGSHVPQIYYSPQSVVDLDILYKECIRFGVPFHQIVFHPRTIILTNDDERLRYKKMEQSLIAHKGSTCSGTGAARAAACLRRAPTADKISFKDGIKVNSNLIKPLLDCWPSDLRTPTIFCEVSQGVGLDMYHGYAHPYVTSKTMLPTTILGLFGLPPRMLGDVILLFRRYPIRVANPICKLSEGLTSGPFPEDSAEITFQSLGRPVEYTSVTKRPRRIATFSAREYQRIVDLVEPTQIIMNFMNYAEPQDLSWMRLVESPCQRYRPTYGMWGPIARQSLIKVDGDMVISPDDLYAGIR